MTYYEALREIRLYHGLSQKDVAQRLGVSKMQISKWETGEGAPPNVGRLIQLADLYNTSIDRLVGRS